MSSFQPLVPHITQVFTQNTNGYLRAAVFGGGLAYALPNGFWHHTPLIFINPFAYASYQVFVSQKDVINWCKQTVKEFS
jgi:hypothetical protein